MTALRLALAGHVGAPLSASSPTRRKERDKERSRSSDGAGHGAGPRGRGMGSGGGRGPVGAVSPHQEEPHGQRISAVTPGTPPVLDRRFVGSIDDAVLTHSAPPADDAS